MCLVVYLAPLPKNLQNTQVSHRIMSFTRFKIRLKTHPHTVSRCASKPADTEWWERCDSIQWCNGLAWELVGDTSKAPMLILCCSCCILLGIASIISHHDYSYACLFFSYLHGMTNCSEHINTTTRQALDDQSFRPHHDVDVMFKFRWDKCKRGST